MQVNNQIASNNFIVRYATDILVEKSIFRYHMVCIKMSITALYK